METSPSRRETEKEHQSQGLEEAMFMHERNSRRRKEGSSKDVVSTLEETRKGLYPWDHGAERKKDFGVC